MKMNSLDDLLHDQLRDLYSAEGQILRALPRLIRKAATQELRQALEDHRRETRGQVERLRLVARMVGVRLLGKKCKAMDGLLREGKEAMKNKGNPLLLDAALIAAAQRVEHYEISAYGTARALAEQLGHEEAAALLQQTLDEEAAADEKLTAIASRDVYPKVKGPEDAVAGREAMASAS